MRVVRLQANPLPSAIPMNEEWENAKFWGYKPSEDTITHKQLPRLGSPSNSSIARKNLEVTALPRNDGTNAIGRGMARAKRYPLSS
jgi:hypothetical protein